MDTVLLESILDISRKRDVDALDLSLVSTLVKFVPLLSISLYKRPDRSNADFIEETIKLSSPTDGTDDYRIVADRDMIPLDKHLEACLKTESAFTHRTESGSVRLLVPISKDHKTAGVLALEGEENMLEHQPLVEIFAELYGNYWTILDESERDKLTGLLNRRTYDKKLNKLLQAQKINQEKQKTSDNPQWRQRKTGPTAWLAVLDIDNFKTINDNYGHLFGDEVILMLSQKMKASFRRSDLLFRFGGDEFVIVLEPIPAEMARLTLERFRQTVTDHRFPQIGNIAISIGYAKITENDFPQTILNQADKALYYAKEKGKDRMFSYQELIDSGVYQEEKKAGATELF